MLAGTLSERVTVQAWTESSRGAMGSSSGTWTTHATVWADIRQLRGDEAIRMATQQSTATYRVKIRRLTTITNAMRLLWGSQILKIDAVEDRRIDGETWLLCTERRSP